MPQRTQAIEFETLKSLQLKQKQKGEKPGPENCDREERIGFGRARQI